MSDAASEKRTLPHASRQEILEAPVDLLPLPIDRKDRLEELGFVTVQEAFRAALAGRLSYRRKAGGKFFEEEVLQACCRLLGHPPLSRQLLRSYRPASSETVAAALERLNGQAFALSEELLDLSVRSMLLPSIMHETLVALGVSRVRQLLSLPLARIGSQGSFGPKTLGSFLIHIFDFLFILNQPEKGLPVPEVPEVEEQGGLSRLKARLLLTTWFPDGVLKAGQALLDSGALSHLLFYRHGAGGLFHESPDGRSGTAIVTFEPAPHLESGFSLQRGSCDLCAPAKTARQACPHAAALTLQLLVSHPQNAERHYPLPLLFDSSVWCAVGQILYDLFGQGASCETELKREGRAWRLTVANKAVHSRPSFLLSTRLIQEGVALFEEKLQKGRPPLCEPQAAARLAELFSRLQDMNCQDAEAALLDLGHCPSDQQRDQSLWLWLARTLSRHIPTGWLELLPPGKNGLFTLRAVDPASGLTLLDMPLPRAKTPEVVDRLVTIDACPPVSQAVALSRIRLEEDGTLVISPWLRLPDGRMVDRTRLESSRYGRYYYLKEVGFMAAHEQPPEELLGKGKEPLGINRIAPNQVPDFLQRHRRVLRSPGNELDPALREFEVQELPDRLELSSCTFDQEWCYLDGRYGVGNQTISLLDLLRAREKGLHHLPNRSRWLKLSNSPLEWFHNLGKDRVCCSGEQQQETIRLSRQELLSLTALVPELRLAMRSEEKAAVEKLLQVDDWQETRDLPVIPAHLRDYQRSGLAWLYSLYRNRLGGILADDMGLGKTHQALGLLQNIRAAHKEPGKFLVVCPATVVAHWVEKITRYYPDLDWFVYHGTNRDLGAGNGSHLFITTYGILRRDAEKLAGMNFRVVIFDEIQHIKNKKTDVYGAATLLKGSVVIGLTGTPLENSVHDLKAVFDLCLPGFLGSDTAFNRQFAEPIEERHQTRTRETLARLLRPFLLRRTRQQVLTELPQVIEDIRTCTLSDDQIRLYREVIANRGRPLLARIAADSQSVLPYMEILATINYLKQICDHPGLLTGPSDSGQLRSGKWDLFVELLEECLDSSMKVVVFSQYTRMLDIIEQYLTRAGISFCGLRGTMPLKTRKSMIERFNNEPSCRVFCASLLAGGVGVDLTAAQAVIHYDRWWNAAREDQATARVHRMGQKHVVQTFKLVTLGTLEEKVNGLIEKKRELANQLIREDDASIIKRLSRDELLELLQWNLPEQGEPASGDLARGYSR